MYYYFTLWKRKWIFREVKWCSWTGSSSGESLAWHSGLCDTKIHHLSPIPFCHPVISKLQFLAQKGVMETWFEVCSLGGAKNPIHYFEWGWNKEGQDHLSSVPTDSLLGKSCSLPLVRNEPQSVRAEGTWHSCYSAFSFYTRAPWSSLRGSDLSKVVMWWISVRACSPES